MTYNIVNDILSPEESDRLYEHFPELKRGVCPTCRGARKYRWRSVEQVCDCAMQLQLAKHYSAAGIGRGYQVLDWSDFVGDPVLLKAVRKYLDNYQAHIDRGVGLLLYGSPGVGKTLVANLVLKELIRNGCSGYSTTFADTIEAFTATWGNPEEKVWFARKFKQSQVLLLDDLGKEMRTRNNLPQSTFDSILRSRIQNARPTILTTNLLPDELGTGYGGSVLSLLHESSLAEEVTGKDWRGQANTRTMDEIDRGETRPIV